MNTQLILFTLMNQEVKATYEFQDSVVSSGIVVQEIRKTRSPGIVLVTVNNATEVMSLIKKLVYEESWRFNCLLKIAKVEAALPLEDWEEGLPKLSEEFSKVIGQRTYRITLHRTRDTELRNRIITRLAGSINGTVKLIDYDYEIVIYLIDSKLHFVFPSSLNQISIAKIRYSTQL
jgi:hypothetical protein